MIIECPKCGFVQPKDRYCAQCGLDIETFVPAPDSLATKLGKNTRLQIGAVITVIVLFAGFIYWSQKNELEKKLREIPQNINSFSTTNNAPSINSEKEEIPELSTSKDNPIKKGLIAAAPALAKSDELADNKNQEKFLGIAGATFTVTFAEASKLFMQQLASDGQILNETAMTRSFISSSIQSLESLKNRDPDFRILPGGQNHILRKENRLTFDFTHLTHEEHEEVGLNLELNPSNVSANTVEFDLLGMLRSREAGSSTLNTQEFNANYVFSPKNTLVIVGLVSKIMTKPEDSQLFSNTPLTIYESQLFQNGTTDFVLFVQVK